MEVSLKTYIINNVVELVVFLFMGFVCKDFIKDFVGFVIKEDIGRWLVDFLPVIALCLINIFSVLENKARAKLPAGGIFYKKNKFDRISELLAVGGILTFWHNSFIVQISYAVNNDETFFFIISTVSVLLYLLPFIISKSRKHHHFLAITLCNVLFGWTVIGWFFAMIWSGTKPKRAVS